MKTIVILSGTNRPGSNTRKVAGHLDAIYRKLDVSVQLLDLHELPPESFTPASYENPPAGLLPFRQAILEAAGVHVVTPEYNGGMPGALKYFIDLLEFPESFEHRPVCFTGLAAGLWGALRPVEQLQSIFSYRNAFIFPERVFLPGISKLLDAQGNFTSAEMPERLAKQAASFVDFVEKLRGTKLR